MALLVLLTATPSYGKAGSCEEVIGACDLALRAQDEEIVGLREALRVSRDQTQKATELARKGESDVFSGVVVPLLLGILVGAGTVGVLK